MIWDAQATLFLVSFFAVSGEWMDIDRQVPQNWKIGLAPIIAKQLQLQKVAIVECFRFNGWSIIHVGTYVDEDRFLFYSGDPFKTPPVTEWGGAAACHETDEIKSWVIVNAKGIPNRLASYFAWRVTKGHE